MDVGELNGHMLYIRLRFDHRLRLWASTSASRAISAVTVLLVSLRCHEWDEAGYTCRFLSAR